MAHLLCLAVIVHGLSKPTTGSASLFETELTWNNAHPYAPAGESASAKWQVGALALRASENRRRFSVMYELGFVPFDNHGRSD